MTAHLTTIGVLPTDATCQCEGWCGRDHDGGACGKPDHPRRPLILAVPGASTVAAAAVPVAELRVWCPGCLTLTERADRHAAAAHGERGQLDLFELAGPTATTPPTTATRRTA